MEEEEEVILKYKLVGVISIFDVIPEFVIPVFENEGTYFTQNCSNLFKIVSFDLRLNPDFIKNVQPLGNKKLIFSRNNFEFVEGDKFIFAYQKSENEVFIGSAHELKEYLCNMNIDDDFMKIEIPHTLNESTEYKRRKRMSGW